MRFLNVFVTIVLVAMVASVASASAINLVQNPGFENPYCNGGYMTSGVYYWSMNTGVYIPYSGLPSDTCNPGGLQNAVCNGYNLQITSTLIQANTTYTLSADVGWNGQSNGTTLFQVEIVSGSVPCSNAKQAGGTLGAVLAASPSVALSTVEAQFTWKTITVTYTPSSTPTGPNKYIGVDLISGTQAIFDNAVLTATPEPATMALLAVGGLVTLMRRRR